MHHEVFYKFKCWQGEVQPGFTPNFLGVVTREHFFTSWMEYHPDKRFVTTAYPEVNEEYFEWIDLLEAVTQAHEKFTMIELGAGWGRWLVNAAVALRAYSGIPCQLIGVEAEPTHFQWMKTHFQDNRLDIDNHQLIQAAVADQDGKGWFLMGRPDRCYGQYLLSKPSRLQWFRSLISNLKDAKDSFRIKRVKTVSLSTLLRPLDRVDLVDLDIQGAELLVLDAASNQLTQKVKKVHVETHNPNVEVGVRQLFQGLGWEKLNDYSGGNRESPTPWGIIKFQGGCQTWINPRLS